MHEPAAHAVAEPIVGVVLAAGGSTRLGRPKPLVTLGGRTLIARALDTAEACDHVVVVLGAAADAVRAEMARVPRARVRWVENREWSRGMASSMVRGLAAVREAWPAAAAVAFFACDQPRVGRAHAQALLATYRDAPEAIVASGYGGGARIPAVFPRAFFPELAELVGDGGAREVLWRHRAQVQQVSCADGELDVDTEEALSSLRARFF